MRREAAPYSILESSPCARSASEHGRHRHPRSPCPVRVRSLFEPRVPRLPLRPRQHPRPVGQLSESAFSSLISTRLPQLPRHPKRCALHSLIAHHSLTLCPRAVCAVKRRFPLEEEPDPAARLHKKCLRQLTASIMSCHAFERMGAHTHDVAAELARMVEDDGYASVWNDFLAGRMYPCAAGWCLPRNAVVRDHMACAYCWSQV